jgi:hypothetical protein
MAVVGQEMVFIRMDDIGAFAEARTVSRLVRDAVAAAPRDVDPSLLEDLRFAAAALGAVVAEGLRAGDPREELRRFRQAGDALDTLREWVWMAFEAGVISAYVFDDLMIASARCRRELAEVERSARGRHLRGYSGMPQSGSCGSGGRGGGSSSVTLPFASSTRNCRG